MGQTTALIGSVIAISNLAQLFFFPLSGKLSSRSDQMAFRSTRFQAFTNHYSFPYCSFFHQGVLILLPQCIFEYQLGILLHQDYSFPSLFRSSTETRRSFRMVRSSPELRRHSGPQSFCFFSLLF